ncbi:hypothetical protein A3H19_05520 [Candidatus Woesebacteria bacterium RIFCSPLOWO2_12_FULL_39_9]|nr:MAG: hypothetical protein A3H19_05520 [Candidatus Woesebacteria bacterium RIFCSPLOWO2_12_FULL_39_9]
MHNYFLKIAQYPFEALAKEGILQYKPLLSCLPKKVMQRREPHNFFDLSLTRSCNAKVHVHRFVNIQFFAFQMYSHLNSRAQKLVDLFCETLNSLALSRQKN